MHVFLMSEVLVGFKVQGIGFRVQGSGVRVLGSGCGVQGVGSKVQGLGRTQVPPLNTSPLSPRSEAGSTAVQLKCV